MIKLHSKVKKIKGYKFEGVVVADFVTIAGKQRFVVDNGDGLLHIFSSEQLEFVEEKSNNITNMNEKIKKVWDSIVADCRDTYYKSINVGGHLRRAAVVAAAEELDRNEEFCRWLPMSGWYYGELTKAWYKDHDESNTRYKFEDVVNAWKEDKTGRREK